MTDDNYQGWTNRETWCASLWMSAKPEIFAVIWNDFIPLSLHCVDADSAVAKARDMKTRANAAGLDVVKMNIRAVHLPAGSDELIVLA